MSDTAIEGKMVLRGGDQFILIYKSRPKRDFVMTIYIFVDASNVWNAVKSVKKFIEYKNFKDY